MTWELEGATILEVVPPTLSSGDEGLQKRLRRVERLLASNAFDAINIPEIHDEDSRDSRGVRTRGFSSRLDGRILARHIRQQFQLPVIINHVVAHDPLEQQLNWLNETVGDYDIRDIVLVGAPHDRFAWPGPSVSEANQAFKSQLGSSGVRIGNICIPERPGSPIPETERMAAKVSAGADFFTTQIVFSPHEISQLWNSMSKDQPELLSTPLLISLCPVKKASNLAFLRYLGVQVPDNVETVLSEVPHGDCLDRSLEILCSLQDDLIQHTSGIPNLAIPGWNIAPVGSIPSSAVLDLMERLPSSVST
ncbi:methylenetetrahydrofolate reductase [Planctomycetota bacterium]|nr:methylenetetrahydrofolate reductase [Planctomycetota bacterium]